MTLKIRIKGRDELEIDHLLLDLNGTISNYKIIPPGLKEYLNELRKFVKIYLVSADTYGSASKIADGLNIELYKLDLENGDLTEAELKGQLVDKLGASKVCAIGNGANDAIMIKKAALGIVILGQEGVAIETLLNADVMFKDPLHALKALIRSEILNATLRK